MFPTKITDDYIYKFGRVVAGYQINQAEGKCFIERFQSKSSRLHRYEHAISSMHHDQSFITPLRYLERMGVY